MRCNSPAVSRAVLRFDEPAQLREGIEDDLQTLRVGQLAAVNLSLPGDGRIDARFDDDHMAPGSAGVPTMGSQQ